MSTHYNCLLCKERVLIAMADEHRCGEATSPPQPQPSGPDPLEKLRVYVAGIEREHDSAHVSADAQRASYHRREIAWECERLARVALAPGLARLALAEADAARAQYQESHVLMLRHASAVRLGLTEDATKAAEAMVARALALAAQGRGAKDPTGA